MPTILAPATFLNDLFNDVALSGSPSQGSVFYRGGSGKWNDLAPSATVGAALVGGGTGANPSWGPVPLDKRGDTATGTILLSYAGFGDALHIQPATLQSGGYKPWSYTPFGGSSPVTYLDQAGKLFLASLNMLTGATNGYILRVTTTGETSWVNTFTTPMFFGFAPPSSANNGSLNLGSAPFDGTTTGFYVGSTSGTQIAINAASGFVGDFQNFEVAGVSKFSVNVVGGIQTPTCYLGNGTNLPVGDPFRGLPYTFIRDSSTNGIALVPSHACWVFMGSAVGDRYNIATSVGAQKFSWDVNATLPRMYAQQTFRIDGTVTSNSAIQLGWHALTNTPVTTTKILSVGYNGAVNSGVANNDNADTTYHEVANVTATGRFYSLADFVSDAAAKGIILKDTQGTPHYWRVTISNVGVLTTTDLGTTLPG